MATRKQLAPRFAICVENAEYPASLELHKVYRVVPDAEAEKDGDLRVIDESGEDYLYPASNFVVVDLSQEVARTLAKSFAGGGVRGGLAQRGGWIAATGRRGRRSWPGCGARWCAVNAARRLAVPEGSPY